MVNGNMMQLFTPSMFNPLPQNPPVSNYPQPVMPANLIKPPHLWSKEEVGAWLAWCAEEYAIDCISSESFNMNGRAVCLLKRDDFMQRSPAAGDVLYNALQVLIKRKFQYLPAAVQTPQFMLMTSEQKFCPASITTTSGQFPTPPLMSPVPTGPSLQQIDYNINKNPNKTTPDMVSSPVSSTDAESLPSEASPNPHIEADLEVPMDQENPEVEHSHNLKQEVTSIKANTGTKRDSDCRLLWEFIYHLLLNNEYSNFICWDNKERLIFRIVNPHGLAKLWGNQKSRSTMTYEKLSRALRYYYKMEIIKKVPGQRLTYQFMQSPKDIKKGQRGARPHYKLEQFYTPSSGQTSEPAEYPANKTSPSIIRRNSIHINTTQHLDDLNSHVYTHLTSPLLKTDPDRLLPTCLNPNQQYLSLEPCKIQMVESKTERQFSPILDPSSPSLSIAPKLSPIRSNDIPKDVLLEPSDIKTEQQFVQFSSTEERSLTPATHYSNGFQLNWTKTVIQDEPEDLSLATGQRTNEPVPGPSSSSLGEA